MYLEVFSQEFQRVVSYLTVCRISNRRFRRWLLWSLARLRIWFGLIEQHGKQEPSNPEVARLHWHVQSVDSLGPDVQMCTFVA